MVLAVRSSQDARTLVRAIREELRNIDPDIPLANVRTLDAVVADSIAPRRLSVVLLSAFSGIALLLASVGMYGVISFLVVQRTHEIGVRMALGAQRSDVLKMVIGHASKLFLIAAAIGLPLAFVTNSALRTLLYQVSPFDISIFLVVTVVLAGVGLLASYLPAVRATRGDPLIALTPQHLTTYDQTSPSRTQIPVRQGEIFLRPARYQSGYRRRRICFDHGPVWRR